MSISFGSKNVKEMYFGSKKVAKVYFGNKLVWPKTKTPVAFDSNCAIYMDDTALANNIFKWGVRNNQTGEDLTWEIGRTNYWLYGPDGELIENKATSALSRDINDLPDGTYALSLNCVNGYVSNNKIPGSGTVSFLLKKGATPTGPVARELNSSLSFLLYDITDSEDFVFYADADYSSVYYWSSYITNQKPSGSIAWGDTTYTFVSKGQLTGMTVKKMADGKYRYSIPKDTATCLCVSIPSAEGPWSAARLGTIYMIDADESPSYISQNKLLFTITDQLPNWNNAVYNGNNLVQDAGWMTPAENGTPYYEE